MSNSTIKADVKGDSSYWALFTIGVFMLPVILAIWCVSWFITQDGPSHLYNAHIIGELLKGSSPAQDFYAINWIPSPNIAGHLFLMACMQLVSPRIADQIMMTLTSAGLTSAVIWLRWQVTGGKGLTLIGPMAVFLALNVMWLWGFYNFLLGACLFPITLGAWWAGRDYMGIKRAVVLAGLIVLSYFCHLVSFSVTIVGLVILTLTTPGPGYRARCYWTALILTPAVPLGFFYYRVIQMAGGVHLSWTHFPSDPWSLRGWFETLVLADPLNLLGTSEALPFLEGTSPWFRLLYPPLWVMIGLSLFAMEALLVRTHGSSSPGHLERGWIILTLLLLGGWVLAPENIGKQHGDMLQMRLLLFAMIASIPIFQVSWSRMRVRAGAVACGVAVAIQSAIVWDYALTANRLVAVFLDAAPYVGTGKRVGTLQINVPYRFRVFPLRHIDNILGIGTGNIVWHNYEATAYYFPVRYRNELSRSIGREFNILEKIDVRASALGRLHWARVLAKHHREIETLVVWGADPRLDAITARWYGPEAEFQRGGMRVFQRR
jgi:hypothetical protein